MIRLQFMNLEGSSSIQSITAPSDPSLLIFTFCLIFSPGAWFGSNTLLLLENTAKVSGDWVTKKTNLHLACSLLCSGFLALFRASWYAVSRDPMGRGTDVSGQWSLRIWDLLTAMWVSWEVDLPPEQPLGPYSPGSHLWWQPHERPKASGTELSCIQILNTQQLSLR